MRACAACLYRDGKTGAAVPPPCGERCCRVCAGWQIKKKGKPTYVCFPLIANGAEGETRTPTGEPPLDPEPSVSTNSTTSARKRHIDKRPAPWQVFSGKKVKKVRPDSGGVSVCLNGCGFWGSYSGLRRAERIFPAPNPTRRTGTPCRSQDSFRK